MKYRQYKFSKLVKVVTRTKAEFSINRWLHLYFSLKLHNIQNEHFSVLNKCKKYFKFNGNVLFCHYWSILDSDKSCNPGRKWCIVLRVLENWPEKIWSSISFLLLNIIDSNFGQLEISVYTLQKYKKNIVY
jgi:hypothetical protein